MCILKLELLAEPFRMQDIELFVRRGHGDSGMWGAESVGMESCELSVCEESVSIRVGDMESVSAEPFHM